MEKVIHFGYGEAVAIFKDEATKGYIFAKFMSPSYADEHVYIPAESVHVTFDKKRLIQMRDLLTEFINDMGVDEKLL